MNIPTTDAELRNLYLSGERSIIRNLPIPTVEVVDAHSYISIKECITNFLSAGKRPKVYEYIDKDLHNIDCITQSLAAQHIYKKAHEINAQSNNDELIIMLGIQWSDDCDPNSSIKCNWGSIWVKTVTFISEDFGNNDHSDTYPISLSYKGKDHDVIERQYMNELNELEFRSSYLYYCKRLNKMVRVHFEIICSLGDQPERRSINYIMDVNSLYCPKYEYACNYTEIMDIITSFEECFDGMLSDDKFDDTKCANCLNWNCVSKPEKASSSPPKMSPKDISLPNNKVLPKEINWFSLRSAIDQASFSFYEGKWNEGNVKAYLSTFSMNNTGANHANHVITHCHSRKALQNAMKCSKMDSNSIRIIENAKINPEKYLLWKGGPYWTSNIPYHAFINVIIHLLFLDIVKPCKTMMIGWLKNNKDAVECAAKRMSVCCDLEKWGLCWLKLINTNSGWASENYLGFSRIMKWYYSIDIEDKKDLISNVMI